jgi:outer membrane protein assembly factor BamB
MRRGSVPEQSGGPERIGPYIVERLLGEGGMGRVHLARAADLPGAPPVALKVVHPQLARDDEFRVRFEREVAAARAVSSRHVVPVLDADPRADVPWSATAYVPGPTLEHAITEDGPLPEDRLRALATALATALADIHAAGLVHRDLKPSNVLLHPEHGPQVIDFGIARAVDGTRLTATGAVIGTPGFMPPELFREGVSGPAGDVFALGAVLAYAATGRRPFGSGPVPRVAYRVLSAPPDLAGVPEGVLPLVRACLATDPAARPTPRQVLVAADPSARPPGLAGRSRRGLVAVAAAVVVILAAGLLVVHGLGSSAKTRGARIGPAAPAVPPPAEPTSGVRDLAASVRLPPAWRDLVRIRHDAPDVDNAYAHEVWLTDDVLVRVGRTAVQGIAPSTGKIRWTLAPPAPGMVPCSAGRTVSRGTGAVLFGTPGASGRATDCDRVVAVGLGGGRALWQRRLPVDRTGWVDDLEHSEEIGVSGDRVLVETDGRMTAYRLSDGGVAWQRSRQEGGCAVNGVTVGPSTYAEALTCSPQGSSAPSGLRTRPTRVRSVRSSDGRVRWTAEVPGDVPIQYLETAEPVSVSLRGPEQSDVGPLLVFDDRGRAGAQVGGAGWKRNRFPPSPRIFGWKDVVIACDESGHGDGVTPSVTAVDTRTGRVRWRYRPRIAGVPLVADVDDRGVVLVELSSDRARRSLLTRLSLDRGLPATVGTLEGPPLPVDDVESVRVTGRHLALFTDTHSLLNKGLAMYAVRAS